MALQWGNETGPMMENSTGEEAPPLQRAEGVLALSARRQAGHGGWQTRRRHLRQGGCSRLLFPRRDEAGLEAVMVNISGGLAGGDRLEAALDCEEGAELLVSSQGHERVYRARDEDPSTVIETRCHLAPHARLDWLPHGTIFFEGSRLERRMEVEMAGSASFLFYESRVFGRYGSNEQLQRFSLRDRLSIRRDGRPVLEERTILHSEAMQALLGHSAVADGACVDATLVLVAPEAEALLGQVRPLLEDVGEGAQFAASAWDGKLIIRGLARRNWAVDTLIHRLLPILRAERRMPTGWRI